MKDIKTKRVAERETDAEPASASVKGAPANICTPESTRLKRMAVIIVCAAFAGAIVLNCVMHRKSSTKPEKKAAVSADADADSLPDSAGSIDTALYLSDDDTVSDSEYSDLYMLDYNSGMFLPDGSIVYEGGLFTGSPSSDNSYSVLLDYMGDVAFTASENVTEVENARVLPLSVISQHTYNGGGAAACGLACLSMMTGESYDTLLRLAPEYADQGDVNSINGGMTIEAVQQMCEEVIGYDLINVYSEDEKPSEIIMHMIDEGKTVMVLVKTRDSKITPDADRAHFIVANGYFVHDGITEIVYANSYRHDYEGLCLDSVDANILDEVISTGFDESPAIAYIF